MRTKNLTKDWHDLFKRFGTMAPVCSSSAVSCKVIKDGPAKLLFSFRVQPVK